MQLRCLVHHLKTHLNHRKMVSREGLIVLSTMAVLLLPFLIFSTTYGYYTHYTIGFANTLLFLILLDRVLRKTHSLRLFGLLLFLGWNMSFDLLSLISTDLYWSLKDIRYEGYINFRNGFIAYEIICIFWKQIKRQLRSCLNFIGRVGGCDISRTVDYVVCEFRVWLANNLRCICSPVKFSYHATTA